MTNLAHIGETALLLLAAYLIGCVLGYGLHRIVHAGRGTRQVSAVPGPVTVPPPLPRQTRSPAARLAASVDNEPLAAAMPRKPRKANPPEFKLPTLSVLRETGADNLKQIKGVGPKIEASLNAMGIVHLDQIAGWSKADVDWVDAQLAFKGRIRREGWVAQARELSQAKAEI